MRTITINRLVDQAGLQEHIVAVHYRIALIRGFWIGMVAGASVVACLWAVVG